MTVFMPANVFVLSGLLGINLYGFGLVAVIVISWTTVINPLSTLLLVEQFRRTILGRFGGKVSAGETTHAAAPKADVQQT